MNHNNCESCCLIPILQMRDSPGRFPTSSSRISLWKGFWGRRHLWGGGGDGEGVKSAFQGNENETTSVPREELKSPPASRSLSLQTHPELMDVRRTPDPTMSIPSTPSSPTPWGLTRHEVTAEGCWQTLPHPGDPAPQAVPELCCRPWGSGALIPSVMAWAGRNEAGVMGEEEAPLQSLHFLQLMTSPRAAGTHPLTPSGSFRAHHSPAGTQRGRAGGREGLGDAGATSGESHGGAGRGNKGRSPNVCRYPIWGSLPSLSLEPL